jgi:tetratricopeptide (TPR) repeat protein
MSDQWDARVAAVWAAAPNLSDDEVLSQIDALAAERGESDAAALFEAAGARDYLGLEEEAEPMYRRAIELGLDAVRYPQAVIQLASTIRNLGKADESVALLSEWLAENGQHPLADQGRAFLALALVSTGREREAAALAIATLATHLDRYSRSLAGYAAEL